MRCHIFHYFIFLYIILNFTDHYRLRPDSKSQVTVRYKKENGALIPIEVDSIVISIQHSPEIDTPQLRAQIKEHVINKVIPAQYLTERTIYHIQPSGLFVIGGPQGDAGLTGRKIIVDTVRYYDTVNLFLFDSYVTKKNQRQYGGHGAHGGGAFSGKDWSKVDRSAAYTGKLKFFFPFF